MTTVQHIAFRTKDLKRQVAFYTKHFGFTTSRVFNKGMKDEFVMLRLGPTCIELFQAADEQRVQSGGEQPVGFMHLAFEVADIGKSVAALHADGVKTDDIIDCGTVVPGLRICFFNDLDGNRIELMQGYRDEKTGR